MNVWKNNRLKLNQTICHRFRTVVCFPDHEKNYKEKIGANISWFHNHEVSIELIAQLQSRQFKLKIYFTKTFQTEFFISQITIIFFFL